MPHYCITGYHHDWDSKVYNTSNKSEFPDDLKTLCRTIVSVIPNLSCPEFEAEAAIINYYPMDATLSGHVDFSEPNQSAPLVSVSFGQNAIFLIGGPTKAQEPVPILLRNGDVLIMSHEARQSYHAVPKITQSESIIVTLNDDFVRSYLGDHRINMNVRQVY